MHSSDFRLSGTGSDARNLQGYGCCEHGNALSLWVALENRQCSRDAQESTMRKLPVISQTNQRASCQKAEEQLGSVRMRTKDEPAKEHLYKTISLLSAAFGFFESLSVSKDC